MQHSRKKGRPKSFDEEFALTAAMEAFWEHGFSSTSYEVLEGATGLRRQSLVYAFGDKHALFLQCLSHYYTSKVGCTVAVLAQNGSALDNIRQVFAAWLSDADDERRRGCLIVNTLGDFGAKDPQIAAIINQAVQGLRDAFTQAFEKAQQQGDISNNLSPQQLALLTVSAGNGALLHCHAECDANTVDEVFQALMAVISH